MGCSATQAAHSTAAAAAATRHSRSKQQQQQQQAATTAAQPKQHRADLLSIPAFHQDMLLLLPGGQAYLDAAAEEAASWGFPGEVTTRQLQSYAGCCCLSISYCLESLIKSNAGQQQFSRHSLVLSAAAVRLALEVQLLAYGAVQRQREQHRQQQQQQVSSLDYQVVTENFALLTWQLLDLQTKALVVISGSCMPPEVLQQAGLQLLQALAAPLQQAQLSRSGDSSLQAGAGAGLLPWCSDNLKSNSVMLFK
jgi:hypothetical protein